jgi:hypothetical protein
MNINLKTLLAVAPFSEQDREMLLRRYDNLTDAHKVKLTNAAWEALSQLYFSKVDTETNQLLIEIREGKRTYNPADFSEIVAKLTYEFAHRLGVAKTAEQIAEVRAMFEKYRG